MTEAETDTTNARADSGLAFFRQAAFSLPDTKAHLIFWSIMIGGLALDLWTKKAVFNWLKFHESFPLIDGFLQLRKAVNDGAAFNLFAGKPYFLAIISIVAILGILVVFIFSGGTHRLIHVALGLFAAGICGNLHDRLFHDGTVRDFIDASWRGYHWPTFNAADSFLCIGVGLLIISTFLIEKPGQKHDQQQK